jgi:hypothetical protein
MAGCQADHEARDAGPCARDQDGAAPPVSAADDRGDDRYDDARDRPTGEVRAERLAGLLERSVE